MNRAQAEAEAIRRWGLGAFAEVIEDSPTVSRHYRVGGTGISGFGVTWVEAFADVERRTPPPTDPGGGTPTRGGRRSTKTLNRDPKNRGKNHG